MQSQDSTPGQSASKQPLVRYGAAAIDYILVCVICLISLTIVMQLWNSDLSVPFSPMDSDALTVLANIKFICQSQPTDVNPYLGAPYGLPLTQFPTIQGVLNGLTRILHLFSHNIFLVVNLLYICTFLLAACAALFVFRFLKTPSYLGIPLSVLYAFLPYHFYRGEAHLNLSLYFLAPLNILTCLWVARDEPLIVFDGRFLRAPYRLLSGNGFIAVAICLFVGLSDVYYAFFACCFLVIAVLIDLDRSILLKRLATAALLIGVIVFSAGIYLAPALYARAAHPVAGAIPERTGAQSQTFALQFASMILPVENHRIGALARLRARYEKESFTNNVEADGNALGFIGVAGMVFLLAQVLRRCRGERDALCRALAILFLFGVLLATVGGFSSVIALTGFMIRSWGRIAPYLSFCCFLGAGLWAANWVRRFRERPGRPLAYGTMLWIVAALLAVGILDETSTVWQFAPRYREEKAEFEAAKEFTAAVEPSVDAGAMIYQIPYAPFFEAGPVKGMNDYAHLMPFLFSERGLKWSYGALRGSAGEALATSLNAMPPPLLLESLCTRGFQGIYIDRWGMGDDDTELETQVSLLLHKAPIVSSDQHRAFFSLRGFTAGSFAGTSADDIRKRAAELQKLLVVSWDRGCYALEGTSGANHRWCSASGELSIKNLGPRPVRADFTMALFTGDANPSPVSIVLPSGAVREFQVGSAGVGVKLSDVIPPGAWKMRIATTAKRVDAPGDPRDLHLRLGDFSILSNGLRIY